MSEWPSYGVAQVGPCSVRRYMKDSEPKETWHANIHLIADAPLLLEEVKRLRAEIAGIDALVLETYEYVQNTVAPFGWESYLMKRFNLIAEHLGLLKNASK